MENIKEVLSNVKTMAIAGHTRPDGDCVGSCMALYLYVKKNYPDIQVDVYLENPKEIFSYIEGPIALKDSNMFNYYIPIIIFGIYSLLCFIFFIISLNFYILVPLEIEKNKKKSF
jgi:nanoRNase/pAp phosphatase (c-di-AMP/oligoRNAs hydrolase)